MIALISDNLNAIAALCRQYGIRKLEVFGSAATGAFDPDTSDVDVIVDLGGYEPGVSRRFFRFADALEALFDRRVDIITEEQIRNPYFRQSVEEQRINVYQTGDSEAVA